MRERRLAAPLPQLEQMHSSSRGHSGHSVSGNHTWWRVCRTVSAQFPGFGSYMALLVKSSPVNADHHVRIGEQGCGSLESSNVLVPEG